MLRVSYNGPVSIGPQLQHAEAIWMAAAVSKNGSSGVRALQVLNVTDRRPKWLLSQVHPDRNPEWRAAAERAAARVNQAMDVRSRHVTEV